MNFECPGARDLLPLYEEGALSPAEAAAMREHLASCSACRAEAALSAASWRLFQKAHAPVMAPQFRELAPLAASPRPSWFSPAWAMGLAAAAFLLGVSFGRRAPAARPSSPVAAASAPAPSGGEGLLETGGPTDSPVALGDASLGGAPGLAAAPVWGEAETALTAKPVARPGPSGLLQRPCWARGQRIAGSPRATEGPDGLLVTPPVGDRRAEGEEGLTIWKEGSWENWGC